MAVRHIREGSADKFNFLAKPDDALKCVICLEVAEEPWQHDMCGKLFCKECHEKQGKERPCPYCRTEQPQYFKDNKSEHN